MEGRHLPRENMLRTVGILQAERRKTEVTTKFPVTKIVIGRLWRRYRTTRELRNQYRGNGWITIAVQDRYVQLDAQRNPTCTVRQLQNQFHQIYRVLVSDQIIRNRLHEAHLRSKRPLSVPSQTRGKRRKRLLWAQAQWN